MATNDGFDDVTLLVMNDLISDKYFTKENSIIYYYVPKVGEEFDQKKFDAVYYLESKGAIKIHDYIRAFRPQNEGPGKLEVEFMILIQHANFQRNYIRCIKELKNESLEKYEQSLLYIKYRKVWRRGLRLMIKRISIIGKQKSLLEGLDSFDPVLRYKLEQLTSKGSKFRSLLRVVRKKIKNTEFRINRVKASKTTYQLIYHRENDFSA